MNIFKDSDRESLLGRIRSLGTESVRLWGTMDQPQALSHMSGQISLALGELEVAKLPFPRIPGFAFLIVHLLPFPKNFRTAPELVATGQKDLEAERQRLIDLIERAAARGPDGPFSPHPAFGQLSGKSWGVLMARHLDHHLRQFSA